MGQMTRPPDIPRITAKIRNAEGFDGWWSAIDRLVGILTVFNTVVLLINTVPSDGAINGRVETIIRCTEGTDRQGGREFLRHYRPLYPYIARFICASHVGRCIFSRAFLLCFCCAVTP